MPTSIRFMEINAVQSPFPIGNDTSGRAQISFNALCRIVGAQTKLEEAVCKLIQDAGLATLGTNMWFGSIAQLPENAPGPFVSVEAGGGLSSVHAHNVNTKQVRPSIHIITRASGYVAARDKADAIHLLLDGKHNLTVTV